MCVLLIGSQIYFRLRGAKKTGLTPPVDAPDETRDMPVRLATRHVPVTPAE
jgi:hypothetical protein